MLLLRLCCALAVSSFLASQVVPGAWLERPASGGPTAYSYSSRLAFDSQRNECVLVMFDAFTNQVFTWDGTAWTARGATPFWGDCRGMVYDPVRDRVVLTTNSNQVWEWDRVVWQMRATTPAPRSLVWHSGLQAVLALDAQGLWRWDGFTWTVLPASVPPLFAGLQNSGGALAYDAVRNVLVASYPNFPTLEWSGAGWSWTGTSNEMRILAAPSFGGVIGLPNSAETLRWAPAQSQWQPLVVGGAPSPIETSSSPPNLSLAYDSHRGRVVAFVQGPDRSRLFEHDPAGSYSPRTWTLGSAWWLTDLGLALQHAAAGDRIVIPAGASVSPIFRIVRKGVHIEAPVGVNLGDWIVRPVGASAFSLTGGVLGQLQVEGGGEFELIHCAVRCSTTIQAAFTRLTHCTFGPLVGSCMAPTAPGIVIDGPAIVDHCTATGTGAASHAGGTFYAQSAIACLSPAPLWVVRSTLNAGPGGSISGAPARAIDLWSGGSATLVGGTNLVGGGSTSGLQGTTDTSWNGATLPASFSLPPFGWISAPVGASIGGSLTVVGAMPPANVVFLFFDTTRQLVPAPGFLLPLQIDPATAVPAAVLSTSNPGFTLVVPNVPALSGLHTHWQGLDAGPSLQLTNLRSVRIL